MTVASGGQDQSMEEILQSIKRIIAEDVDVDVAADVNPLANSASVRGSDVLELTDFVEDDASSSAAAEVEEVAEPPMLSLDDIMASFEPVAQPASISEPELEPEPEPEPEMHMQDTEVSSVLAFADDEPELSTKDVLSDIDTLLSDDVARSASSAFKELAALRSRPETAHHTPDNLPLRSGTTVEDLMLELLRPMMKQWLDTHLPEVVERLVQQEIRRIAE